METAKFERVLQGQYDMMKNGEYSDFRIRVRENVFHVHKMVLAARSSYFNALFTSSMMETEENLLTLEDIDVDLFQRLLKYVYTCEFDDLWYSSEDVLKLMMHAEKFGLTDLVADCEAYLLEKIDMNIAARCAQAGDLLKLRKLKLRALSLMADDWDVIFTTDGWNDVIYNHSLMTSLEKCEYSKLRQFENNSWIGDAVYNEVNGEAIWSVLNLRNDGLQSFVGTSNAFSLVGDDQATYWRFRLDSTDLELHISLLHTGPPVVNPVKFTYALIVFKSDRRLVCTGSFDTSCCFRQNSYCRISLGHWRSRVSGPSNLFQGASVSVTIKKCSEKITETSSMDYLSEYLENSRFTDAVVRVGGEEFLVHRMILSAASPVFKEKLGNQEESYELEDQMDPETFRNLLLVIYNGPEIPVPNFELLRAAKLFKLSNKQINRCRAEVFLTMKDHNVIDFLIQAHVLQDPILKNMIFKRMVNDFEAVLQLDDWNQLSKYPELHDDFFKFVVSMGQNLA